MNTPMNTPKVRETAFDPGKGGRCASKALFELHQSLQGFKEFTKSWSWKHDGIAPPSHVLCDLQETTPLVFLEVEKEYLPLVGHFFRGYRLWS